MKRVALAGEKKCMLRQNYIGAGQTIYIYMEIFEMNVHWYIASILTIKDHYNAKCTITQLCRCKRCFNKKEHYF